MNLLTILLFFVYTWGLGFTIIKLVSKSDSRSYLEKNLMNFGIGLATFFTLSLLLNLFRIPLDWRIFLFLSMALPIFDFIKNKKFKFKIKLSRSNIYIFFVLVLFAFTFHMYHKGAFAYPYLEDGDPYKHALGAKYVSIEKSGFVSPDMANVFGYMDAYPPGYDIIMGVLHQTSPDLMWTLKFFNALIISLGIIFFYFFAKEFTGNKEKALISTFALAMIPAYMSHFIWAHSLIPTLFFVSIYCLEQIKYSKKWFYISALVIAAIPLIQPTQPMKLGVMFFIYWAVKAIAQKKWLIETIGSISVGYLIAILLWWVPMAFKYGSNLLVEGIGWGASVGGSALSEKSGIIGPIGSATRLYTPSDFFIAKSQNMINNPVGIGFVLFSLALIGILFIILFKYKSLLKNKSSYKLIAILWFIFTFLGLFGGTLLPIALVSFRFWMLFAIPVALLAAEGAFLLLAVGKSLRIPKLVLIVLLVFLVWNTSGQQKYDVNTAMWGPGYWLGQAQGDLYTFLWVKQNLPIDTPVFVSALSAYINAFNVYSCEWCPEVIKFRENILNKSVDEIHFWLKKENYEYIIIEEYIARNNDFNKTAQMVNEMINSNLYNLMYRPNINGQELFAFVFKVN